MDYRAKAINCVKDTALPIQMQWFIECSCNLDTYCQKYGEIDFFFAEVIEKRHIYEKGYPRCVCPEALTGGKEAPFCEYFRQGLWYFQLLKQKF